MTSILLIIAMTTAYASGGLLLAQAAKAGTPLALAASYVAYMAGNLAYLVLIKNHGFGAMATLSSAVLIVLSVLAARVFFGEPITARMWLGLLCAVLAVILVAPPSIWRA